MRTLRIRIGFVVVATVITLTGPQAALSRDRVSDIFRKLEVRYRKVRSIRAELTVQRYNGQLKETDTILGVLTYASPSGRGFSLRVDLKRPDEFLTVNDGNYMIYRPRLNRAYVGNLRNGRPLGGFTSFFDIANLSKAELLANFTTEFQGRQALPGGVRADLVMVTPKATSVIRSVEIWVDKKGLIRRARMFERSGDITTFTLTKIKKNPKLPERAFVVPLPKSAVILRT